MHARAAITLVLLTLAVGACGGGSDDGDAARTAQQQEQQQAQPTPSVPGGSLEIPANVPLRASRNGDPAAIKVIRLWTDALRRSDVERASALWALPSKVQNGTPVVTLATRGDVRLFNDSLTCGSRLVSAGGAENEFTIAVFVLTNRPGADCGTGVGHRARTAILVRGGKIAEWYRLPDDPDAPRPRAPRGEEPAEPRDEPRGPVI